MKAVHKHTKSEWIILYIERWLKAPMQMPEGTQKQRDRGTPQGGVISPVLSNLFMHYAFDELIHLKTELEAQEMLVALRKHFEKCGLELHPLKTRIVYCKDGRRRKKYPNKSFDFLGYTQIS